MQTVDNLRDALDVLIQAAIVGQKNGCYTLKESSLIQSSIEYLQLLSGNNSESVDQDISAVEE